MLVSARDGSLVCGYEVVGSNLIERVSVDDLQLRSSSSLMKRPPQRRIISAAIDLSLTFAF